MWSAIPDFPPPPTIPSLHLANLPTAPHPTTPNYPKSPTPTDPPAPSSPPPHRLNLFLILSPTRSPHRTPHRSPENWHNPPNTPAQTSPSAIANGPPLQPNKSSPSHQNPKLSPAAYPAHTSSRSATTPKPYPKSQPSAPH